MAKVLTGISGNLISAASAGFAPTNSADVSAIASAYQVVSATATQLYAGTAYVTSVNGAPLSASRAGNAANASLATSAWYDGTGRLISALPDSAAVSAIASAYAESAASSKQDELTFSYDENDRIDGINGSALAGQGGGGGAVDSPSGTIIVTDGTAIEATNSAIGSSTVEQKFLNYAPNASQIVNWQSTVLLQGESVSGASLMKLQALTDPYTVTASAVYSAIISGYPIGGGSELIGSASATAYGSSMEFNFPLDPSWGFGSIWASSRYYSLNLNTADNNAIAFYSASTSSGVKELAWKDDIPAPIDLGIYENIYHDKYVSSINSIPVSAKWAGSANYANYAYTASQDPNGRDLSALADKSSVPTGITSPNGTIIANGFNVEATNSAVTTTVVPGYAPTVVGNTAQLRPDTPVVCTLPSANENSKLFFELDYGADMYVSAVYDGITATASAGAGTPEVVLDVPNATTVSLYGSWYRYMLGSASASAADYLAPGSIGELAWASALPTYEYDAEDKISAINGSAIAGGAGGATGDYVEKSATSVTIGTSNTAGEYSLAIGSGNYIDRSESLVVGTDNSADLRNIAVGAGNSADLDSIAVGFNNASYIGAAIGQMNTGERNSLALGMSSYASNNSIAVGKNASAEGNPYSLGGSIAVGLDVSAGDGSYAVGGSSIATDVSFAHGFSLSATHSAAVFGTYNLSGDGSGSSGAAFVLGDGTASNARHDLMVVTRDGEITMYSSTADTTGTGIMSSIRALSANAGGVDSATVSAIASAYAESAASSKLDTTAFNSGDFYSTSNPSGFIDSAYVDSSVSGKADSSALSSYVPYSSLEYNTASAISGINGSALAAGSTYSAGEGIDITDDVISVEAPVDIVAGPGIVIDNPDGNTLRVSQTEPVVDAVRDCENWNGHTMKCIILRGAYTTNTSMQNQYIENVLPVGTTLAFIDGSNSYVVYGDNPQINMMVPYHIDNNRLFSPWVDITNRRVNLRYIDVSNNITCTYYLCVKYAID